MDKDKRLVNKNLANITKTIDVAGYNEDVILKHQNEVSRTICASTYLGYAYNPSHTRIFPIYSINCYLYDGEQPSLNVVNIPNGSWRNCITIAYNITKNILIEGGSSVYTGLKVGTMTMAPNIQTTAIEEHYLQRWACGGTFSLDDLHAEPGDIVEFALIIEGYQYIDGKYIRCTYPQQSQYVAIS